MLDAPNAVIPDREPEDDSASMPARSGPGSLARKFVDVLLAAAGRHRTDQVQAGSGGFADPIDFDDDIDLAEPVAPEVVTLSIDEAAAAILLAVAFEPEPSLLRSLRRESPVIVVQIPDEDLQDPVRRVLQTCVLGRGTNIVSTAELDT